MLFPLRSTIFTLLLALTTLPPYIYIRYAYNIPSSLFKQITKHLPIRIRKNYYSRPRKTLRVGGSIT